jgi:hypothetical protein
MDQLGTTIARTTTATHTPWCVTHIAEDGYRACYGPSIDLTFPDRDSRSDACHSATVAVTDDSESGRTVGLAIAGGMLYEILPDEARALAFALLAQAARADGDEDAHAIHAEVSAEFTAPLTASRS